jgi:hypothetical protein
MAFNPTRENNRMITIHILPAGRHLAIENQIIYS